MVCFFLGSPVLVRFLASSEDDSIPDDEGVDEVKTRSYIGSSNSIFTVLAAY